MATGLKPRMRHEWSILKQRKMWFCRGGGLLERADSPKDAYLIWKNRMRLKDL